MPSKQRNPAFPSWKGEARHKREVLDRARFAICYENSRGNPGYITEKIFDCFTSGCIPVYIGTKHGKDPVPKDCYIDGEQLLNPADLLAALRGMSESRCADMQAAMRRFLSSSEARMYSNDHWCDTIVSDVVRLIRD
jgi:hypothetical protein